jgi:hypothetical protein
MTNLDELLAELRTAQTTAAYDAIIARLQEAQTNIAELASRMKVEEERCLFAGEPHEPARRTMRECEEQLATIEVALRGAERRRQEASLREDHEATAELGEQVAARGRELSEKYLVIRQHLIAVRALIFETVPLQYKQDAGNDALERAGRRDLALTVSSIRGKVLGEALERAPNGLPRSMLDADAVLVGLAEGGRPWRGPGLHTVPRARPSPTPAVA